MAWLGALPAGAYQLPIGQRETASEPFVWSGGGRRSLEDIALDRRMAASQMMAGADFSPVGHWTQGLARAAQGVLGGLEMGELRDEAAEVKAAQDAQNASVAQALISGGGGQDIVAQALVDPNLSPEVRGLAKMQYDRLNPKPVAPGENEKLLMAAGLIPGTPEYQAAAQKLLANRNDPFITANIAPGRFYAGPQSGLGAFMGGGDPISGVEGGAAPALPSKPIGKLTPINGGPTPTASGGFPGAAR